MLIYGDAYLVVEVAVCRVEDFYSLFKQASFVLYSERFEYEFQLKYFGALTLEVFVV